jgi:endonuclease YncB( thermonuclease family)
MTKNISIHSPRRHHANRRRLFQRRSGWAWRWWALIGIVAAAGWVQGASAPGADGGLEPRPVFSHAHAARNSGKFRACAHSGQRNCVVDGDTVHIDGRKIRLEDIDAPEAHNAHCPAEQELGERAKQRLVELLNYGHFKVVDTGGRDADRYGRKLRVIRQNGRSVGDTLIREGLARAWTGHRESWCS